MRGKPDSTKMRRLRHWAWSLPFVVGLSCVSPTLPPDEPPEPEVELGQGVVYLRGGVPAAPAIVLVHNRETGLIFGQRTVTGAYAFEVAAERCDVLALWYESGSFESTAVQFQPAVVVTGDRDACRDGVPPTAADGGADDP